MKIHGTKMVCPDDSMLHYSQSKTVKVYSNLDYRFSKHVLCNFTNPFGLDVHVKVI
jgi:IS4 transposase